MRRRAVRLRPHTPKPLIVVDTDLPVPQIAGRLRVDLYAEDGTWYVSRDVGLPGVTDWPASFSVYSPNEASDTEVLMRLRVYPDGFVRDYLGEQYENRNGPLPNPAGVNDTGPRLVTNGVDVTPPSEPQPLVTVDRLVLLRLQPGVRGRVRVTMHGECAGTMALLTQNPPYQTPSGAKAATCVDTENTLDFLTPAPLESDMSIPPATMLGAFAAEGTCSSDAGSARTQCVPSGVFILGDKRVIDMGAPYDGVPERLVAMDRFWIDRNEVTVAQLRASLGRGFYSGRSLPIGVHDGPLGHPLPSDENPLDQWCTWSTTPMGREDFPLSCLEWDFARDYCKSVGGDLTTEAEWEYATTAAGRPFKADYPWGNDVPTCDEVIYDRVTLDNHVPACAATPGPLPPMTTTPYDSTPSGVLNLAGSQAELMLDNLAAYSDPCWMTTSIHNRHRASTRRSRFTCCAVDPGRCRRLISSLRGATTRAYRQSARSTGFGAPSPPVPREP